MRREVWQGSVGVRREVWQGYMYVCVRRGGVARVWLSEEGRPGKGMCV